MNQMTAPDTKRAILLAQDRVKRVYIAGPMTGLVDLNFPAFNAMAAHMRAEGWHVENPAEHGVVEGAEWADYLRYDIGRLATCEAMMLLPGWSKSKGANLEVTIALQLGMSILLAVDAEEIPSEDGWIKYSEQSPGDEHDGFVLNVAVTDQRGRPISECAVWNKGIKKKGRFDFWETKITHWRPLPPPPGVGQ